MKRTVCLLCALFTILIVAGCTSKSGDIHVPVSFYYCANSIAYNDESGLIVAEIREGSDCETIEELLTVYLQGPSSDELSNPMPSDIQLISGRQDQDIFEIYLSDSFADMKGIQQSLAGACLAKTIMELTDVSTVQIYTPQETQPAAPVMVLNEASFLLIDNCR